MRLCAYRLNITRKKKVTKYNPVNGIIIIRIDRRDTSPGGIALVNKEKLDYGVIVATGPGEYKNDGTFREVTVKVGQRIVIAPGSGVELELDGDKLTFMVQDDIVGVINEKDEIEDV